MQFSWRNLSIFGILLLLPQRAFACPLCSLAVMSGLGLSRYLMVDDVISGIWAGGFLLSLLAWGLQRFGRSRWLLRLLLILDTFLLYALIIIPLLSSQIIGHPLNQIFGMDKFIFGTLLGAFVFVLAWICHLGIRKRYGVNLIPYQNTLLSLLVLISTSLVVHIWL